MSNEAHRRDGNLRGGSSTVGTSGTSSANTTAKPLEQRTNQYDQQDTYEENDWRIQVPVDVAVEEPGARVVGKEPNCDYIPGVTHTYDIPDNGVVKIVGGVASAANYMEAVPVQMNRMLLREATAINITLSWQQSANTHRPTNDTPRNGQLDTLVRIETIDAACGK
jgi:hypothetical protein